MTVPPIPTHEVVKLSVTKPSPKDGGSSTRKRSGSISASSRPLDSSRLLSLNNHQLQQGTPQSSLLGGDRKMKSSKLARLDTRRVAGRNRSHSNATRTVGTPVKEYLNKITMKPEDCVQEMKKGTTMVKFGKPSKPPQYRRFYLSESEQYLNWSTDGKDASVTRIMIRDIRQIIEGQETLRFKTCTDYLDKTDVSFSIIFGHDDRTLDLVAGSKKDFFIYTQGLRYLMTRAKLGGSTLTRRKKNPDFKGITYEQRYIVLEAFRKYDTATSDTPRIYNRDLKNVCHALGLDFSHDEFVELTQLLDPKDTGYIEFEDFLIHCIEEILAESSPFEVALQAFRTLDVHNTGFIAKRELRSILMNAAPLINENEIDEMISECVSFKGYVPYVDFVYKMFEGSSLSIPSRESLKAPTPTFKPS